MALNKEKKKQLVFYIGLALFVIIAMVYYLYSIKDWQELGKEIDNTSKEIEQSQKEYEEKKLNLIL